ncbi:YeeE/YedE family protein [Tenacibaculum sp. M341]|uniref:YeeE/YedE family protein n=1 Tax=Tenacibaculum sp. M341 TaxID=2530339 RepID=UPI0010463498|nr:YeeE/YedE thiosulfate transporter family protein [Tenacibaculum sp. M341]TCI94202.1 YeeE/YedE family protein [Tenacibaculum sp. M341]
MDFILQPWAWYVTGPLIAIVSFLTFYFGKSFGISTNLETMCTIAGAGKVSDYFKKDWKERDWAIAMIIGLIIGGVITRSFLSTEQVTNISPETINDLQKLGFEYHQNLYAPNELFSLDKLLTVKGFSILLIAGLLIGFGTRYAGGCTSGHAITGLSSLQLPSLIAVIGFFVGGLIMVWILFPLIF